MESFQTASQNADSEDALLNNVGDCAATGSGEKVTDVGARDAVSSCSTTDDHSVSVESETSTVPLDPYSYVQRGDYTSEVYKLELMNLPRRFGIAQLKKKLVHLGLNPCKIKTIEFGHYAFVTFRNETEMEKAVSVLQGHTWKNKEIKVKKALPTADPLLLKRQREKSSVAEHVAAAKQMKLEDTERATSELPCEERLNDVVTPLWRMPYQQQLEKKETFVKQFMKQLCKEIAKNNEYYKSQMMKHRDKSKPLGYTIHPIKPSPITVEYRNKCEFTIGVDPQGNDNTVGFRLGSYRNGDLSVLEPTGCVNITSSMKTIAKELQTCLQSRSTRLSFNPIVRRGHWQTAVIRVTSNGKAMLVVVMHPQDLSLDEIQAEKTTLKTYFEQIEDKDLLASLCLQLESDRDEKGMQSCEVLLGENTVEETLLEMKFRISPSAFFQVNTPAAELLYTSISDLCNISSSTTLVDVCCGTGTIGLTLAKSAKNVIGIELCSDAVEDAKTNARINGITNAEFICGKAEDVLPNLMWRLAGQEVVVVVDPPRAGLHADVIRAVRRCPCVSRLVYVSCKPTSAKQNIVDLTRQPSKRVTGKPFVVKEVAAVDMFPHTELYELVMLLERNGPD